MKIFSAEQTHRTDQYTIENESIASIDLMERAAGTFVRWFSSHYKPQGKIYVFCGTGNNGGDGLAASRMLIGNGLKVVPYTVKASGKRSPNFETNLQRLKEIADVTNIEAEEELKADIDKKDIIIDAMFGSGLARPVSGIYAYVIRFINDSLAQTVSIDIPSGLYCDAHSEGGEIVEADHVVTFQMPKLAFFMPENSPYVGYWHVVDIGLSKEFIAGEPADYYYLQKPYIKKLLKKRNRFAHKVNFGRVMLIEGSYGKMGAAVLSARGCLRSGAGLVTVHIPRCGYEIMQTAVPEAMVSVDVNERYIFSVPDLEPYNALGIGPGLDQHIDTYDVLCRILELYKKPVVLDADALNIIAAHPELLDKIPEGSILTPHPGEFRRLSGLLAHDFERMEKQIAMSKKHKIFIVLKGQHTAISTPDGKVYFNSTGNPGMATGGSGDVLTGILTGLLGQGYLPGAAAVLGVYLHGLAGDLAAELLGEEFLIASDITDYLSDAYYEVRS
jgi:NAD(P)H-hydrate epimerase